MPPPGSWRLRPFPGIKFFLSSADYQTLFKIINPNRSPCPSFNLKIMAATKAGKNSAPGWPGF
jgi:hypothetical protein